MHPTALYVQWALTDSGCLWKGVAGNESSLHSLPLSPRVCSFGLCPARFLQTSCKDGEESARAGKRDSVSSLTPKLYKSETGREKVHLPKNNSLDMLNSEIHGRSGRSSIIYVFMV